MAHLTFGSHGASLGKGVPISVRGMGAYHFMQPGRHIPET